MDAMSSGGKEEQSVELRVHGVTLASGALYMCLLHQVLIKETQGTTGKSQICLPYSHSGLTTSSAWQCEMSGTCSCSPHSRQLPLSRHTHHVGHYHHVL
jgi:hypothetical protein